MARRADVLVESLVVNPSWNGAGTNYIVQTPTGVLYMIYAEGNSDVSFRKSSDGGLTWSRATIVLAGTVNNLAVWYDRWSNIAADLIHLAYTDGADSDTKYRTIDTASSDALSTQTVIFAGTSVAAGGHLSITRAVGGNVLCKSVIDAGAEGGFFRLTNANVPNGAWASRTVDEAIATKDQMILLPDFDAADTQDIMAIFWDASANEVSRKLYDDSANSWSETSIATSMTELDTATAFANFAAAPDIANTRHVVLAWSNTDTSTARLQCWTVDSGAITAKTDVVSASTDDQGLCAISIDTVTGYWYAFYGGITTGGETWQSAIHVYYKVSQDTGTTWGAETLVDKNAAMSLRQLYTCPRRSTGPWIVAWLDNLTNGNDLRMSVDVTQPRASYVAGIF